MKEGHFMMRLLPLLLIAELLALSTANLDLFMSEKEVKTLLGLNAELYYIRNGTVNNYAMNFTMPIPDDISALHFNWQNLRTNPPQPMPYSIGILYKKNRAMGKPQLSIRSEGIVPTKLSVFRITLPCTGVDSSQIDFTVQMNISIFSATNITSLNFKRRKICLKDPKLALAGVDGHFDEVFGEDEKVQRENSEGSGGLNRTFYIAVGCAASMVFVVTAILLFYYIRSRKTTDRASETSSAYGPPSAMRQNHLLVPGTGTAQNHHAGASLVSGPPNQRQLFLRADTPNNMSTVSANFSSTSGSQHHQLLHGGVGGGGGGRPGVSGVRGGGRAAVYAPAMLVPATYEETLVDPRQLLREVAIERNKVSLGEVLLEGGFGRVYHGILLGNENEIGTEQDVFIKTVTEQASFDQTTRMLRECCKTKGVPRHDNVLSVLGACLDNERQPMVLFPFASQGNLKKFLQKCRTSADAHVSATLSTKDHVHFGMQILRGIQHLHRHRIIHKDLATRNCVIDEDLTVKVSDGALSRDLFSHDYDCLVDNENRPVKWLAIESIMDKRFSTASDVWMYGVCLWELMTLAHQPYADVDPTEMAAYLREGYRVSQPINCPDELYSVMSCCWALVPEERPTFPQILACLQDFHAALDRFV